MPGLWGQVALLLSQPFSHLCIQSQLFCWTPQHRALRAPAGARLFWSFPSGQFGISSVPWIFEPGQGLFSLSLSCVDIMTDNEQQLSPAIQRSLE